MQLFRTWLIYSQAAPAERGVRIREDQTSPILRSKRLHGSWACCVGGMASAYERSTIGEPRARPTPLSRCPLGRARNPSKVLGLDRLIEVLPGMLSNPSMAVMREREDEKFQSSGCFLFLLGYPLLDPWSRVTRAQTLPETIVGSRGW